MYNDNSADSLLKEAQSDLKKEKFLNILNQYKYIIATVIIVLAAIVIAISLYNSHINKLAAKDSLIFNSVQEKLMAGDTKGATTLLNELEAKGTNGYQLISSLQEADLSLQKKDYPAAISELNKINSFKLPPYYKDLANLTIFSIRLDNDKDLKPLINDMKAVKPNNTFYYADLELYAMALIQTQDYNTALTVINQIINADKASNGIKQRAKGLQSIVLAYVK